MSTWLKSQTRRIKQQTLQAVGVAKQTKDPVFDTHVARFTDLQEAFERVHTKFANYERCLTALSKASSELNAELHIFCAASSARRNESTDTEKPQPRRNSDSHETKRAPIPLQDFNMSSALKDPSFLDRSSRANASKAVVPTIPSLLNVVNYMQAAHISIQYSVVDITRKVFKEEVLRPLGNVAAQMDAMTRKIKERQTLMLDYDHFKRADEHANAKGEMNHMSKTASNLAAAEKKATDATRALKDQFQGLEARRATMLAPQVAAFMACELHNFQRSTDYLAPVLASFPEVAGPMARLSSETHQFHNRIRDNSTNPRFTVIAAAIETTTKGRLPPTYSSGKDSISSHSSGPFHDHQHAHRLRCYWLNYFVLKHPYEMNFGTAKSLLTYSHWNPTG